MDLEARWRTVVDLVAVVWIGLFVATLASAAGLLALDAGTAATVRGILRWLLVVFLLDVALLYRWSKKGPLAFARANWLRILTVVPWFRPFRLLRAGRGLRAVRVLARSRRASAFVNKLRRMVSRLRSPDDE